MDDVLSILADAMDDEVTNGLAGVDDPSVNTMAAARDQLAALKAHGYAVVKLPEMEVGSLDQSGWLLPEVDKFAEVYVRRSDGRIAWSSVKNPIDNPEHALSLAAALIAAARYVQEKNGA
jgi:hypothetical protein